MCCTQFEGNPAGPQLRRVVPPLRPLYLISVSRLLHVLCRRSRLASSMPQMRCGHLGYLTRAPVPQPSCSAWPPNLPDAPRAAQAKHEVGRDPAAPSALLISSPRGGPGEAATLAGASGGGGGTEGGRGRAGSEGPSPGRNRGVSPVGGKHHAACDTHTPEAGKASRGAGITQNRLHDPHSRWRAPLPKPSACFTALLRAPHVCASPRPLTREAWQSAVAGGSSGPAGV